MAETDVVIIATLANKYLQYPELYVDILAR